MDPVTIAQIAALLSKGISMAGNARQNWQYQNMINNEKSNAYNWYNALTRQPYMQRADAQSTITQLTGMLKKNMSQMANRSRVIGGTPDALNSLQSGAQNTVANTVGRMAGNADLQKMRAYQLLMSRLNQLNTMQAGRYNAKINSWNNISADANQVLNTLLMSQMVGAKGLPTGATNGINMSNLSSIIYRYLQGTPKLNVPKLIP